MLFEKTLSWLVGVLTMGVLLGCSNRVHKSFKYNHYVRDFHIHIVNDTQQVYFRSPADIVYTTNKRRLNRLLRHLDFEVEKGVLVYGSTDYPPYAFFLALSGPKDTFDYPDSLVVLDTILKHQRFRFVGIPRAPKAIYALEADLRDMFESLEMGEGYRKEISTVMDIVARYRSSNAYLAALEAIRDYPAYDKQEEWLKLQMELTFASYLGENKEYDALWQKLQSHGGTPDTNMVHTIQTRGITGEAALDTILSEARGHKLVMFNENHYAPRHRALLVRLLQGLRKEGFNTLALEALGAGQDSVLNAPGGFPTLATGFYTREQHYNRLIHTARRMGFRFVAYESQDAGIDREVGQAVHLYDKTFGQDTASRVVVLAGFDHILERETKRGRRWLAKVFRDKYHIDPLTISQTHLDKYSHQATREYTLLKGRYFKEHRLQSVDLLLLNNLRMQQDMGDTMRVYKNSFDEEVQVALFYPEELKSRTDYYDKVPYFTTLVEKNQRIRLPVLKHKGAYILVLDRKGNRLSLQQIAPEPE